MVSERATWNYKCVIIKPVILFLVVLFLLGRSRMKKWHIAALVIVGLIVAGIAYAMYERKRGTKRRLSSGGGSAILQNHQRHKDSPPIIPGMKKTEKETNTIGTSAGYEDWDLREQRAEKKARFDEWALDATDWTFEDLGMYN